MVTFILLILIIVLVAVFSVQNAVPVSVTFFFWKFEASLAIVVFLSALCGLIAGIIAALLMRTKSSGKKETQSRPQSQINP
jgi:uncharacterized integral membrane protein